LDCRFTGDYLLWRVELCMANHPTLGGYGTNKLVRCPAHHCFRTSPMIFFSFIFNLLFLLFPAYFPILRGCPDLRERKDEHANTLSRMPSTHSRTFRLFKERSRGLFTIVDRVRICPRRSSTLHELLDPHPHREIMEDSSKKYDSQILETL
jgi:hypothetical protein